MDKKTIYAMKNAFDEIVKIIQEEAVQTRKQELLEERIAYIERTEARGKLHESEKRLSQNIYEWGVDDAD